MPIKALILKDCYMMLAQLKLFLLMIVIVVLCQPDFGCAFGTMYAMMLPLSTLAYDEQSKWPQLASMLPYKIRDMVISKYAFGWLLGLLIVLMSLPMVIWTDQSLNFILLSFVFGQIFMLFNLPLAFWLGSEKGRLLVVALVGTIFAMLGAMFSISAKFGGWLPNSLRSAASVPAVVVLLGLVLLNVVSITLSVRLYKRRLMRG